MQTETSLYLSVTLESAMWTVCGIAIWLHSIFASEMSLLPAHNM